MDFSPVGRVCSFCGKVGTKKTTFFGGLGAMICSECVEHNYETLHSRSATAAAKHPPWERMSDVEMLSALPDIAANARQVDKFMVDWVAMIRGRGISWAAIGQALGVSRQAVWERFSRAVVISSSKSGRAG